MSAAGSAPVAAPAAPVPSARPHTVRPVPITELAAVLTTEDHPFDVDHATAVTGVTLRASDVHPGDLFAALPGALGVGEDGGGPAGEGLGGEVGAVRAGARQRGEQVAGPHVRGPQGDSRDDRLSMIVVWLHTRPDLAAFRNELAIITGRDDGGDLAERDRADRVRSCGRSGRGGGGDRNGTGG